MIKGDDHSRRASAICCSSSSARIRAIARRTSQRTERGSAGRVPTDIYHGIGLGPGKGATPHIADAQGGRGGVGIRNAFPCLDGEQFGSVAGLHVMPHPVDVMMAGEGRGIPAPSARREATTWFLSPSPHPKL